jgi:hypothetical protein
VFVTVYIDLELVYVVYVFRYSEFVLFVFTDPVAAMDPGPRPRVRRTNGRTGEMDLTNVCSQSCQPTNFDMGTCIPQEIQGFCFSLILAMFEKITNAYFTNLLKKELRFELF